MLLMLPANDSAACLSRAPETSQSHVSYPGLERTPQPKPNVRQHTDNSCSLVKHPKAAATPDFMLCTATQTHTQPTAESRRVAHTTACSLTGQVQVAKLRKLGQGLSQQITFSVAISSRGVLHTICKAWTCIAQHLAVDCTGIVRVTHRTATVLASEEAEPALLAIPFLPQLSLSPQASNPQQHKPVTCEHTP